MAYISKKQLTVLANVFACLAWCVSFGVHANPEALGNKHFAIVLFDYSKEGTAPPKQDVFRAFFGTDHSINRYIETVSYGKTTITGEVFDWIRPKRSLYGTGWTACWPLDQDRFTELIKHYPKVDLASYDGFLFVIHRDKSRNCGPGVSNTYGLQPRPTYTKFGFLETRIAYLTSTFYFPHDFSQTTSATAMHELLHTFGISNHSNAIDCEASELIPRLTDCVILAYGDIFSAMGSRNLGSQPNSVNRERLGWLTEPDFQRVLKPGNYTINHLGSKNKKPRAAKISLKHAIPLKNGLAADTLYLEYRSLSGFDQRGTYFWTIKLNNGGVFRPVNVNGLLVYAADCRTNDYCIPYLLNMNPGSVDAVAPQFVMSNSFLREGEAFKVPMNDLTITVLEADQTKGTIKFSVTRKN